MNTKDPSVERPIAKKRHEERERYISDIRNEKAFESIVEKDAKTRDYYNNNHDPFQWTILDSEDYDRYIERLNEKEKEIIDKGLNYYQIDLSSPGGLIMPVILEFEYSDGTKEVHRIPAEIWKMNHENVSKVFMSEKELVRVVLDPTLETADTDRSNNYWPAKVEPTRFELYKERERQQENPMQRAKRAAERGEK
jgi:hypothetical protein